jgi:6-pyruvoyltetrahydropterin/6-carboxytetrahydropterin synthase
MYRVTKSIAFCYGHRLLHHPGLCRHLHGHNARAVITLEAESLDALGMVVDFNDIKERIKSWIDREIDHVMLLHREDPFVAVMREHDERLYVTDFNPTAENIARMIFDYARTQNLPVVEVTLWETETSYATYRP